MPEEPRQGSRAVRIAVRVVIPVLFALALWYVFTHVVRFGYVASSSMEPTLQVGDYYILHLRAYDDELPEFGDVVVYAGRDGAPYVKRVVGLPGDTLLIALGRVRRNDTWVEEPYTTNAPVPEPPVFGRIPEGRVFVLGDNRGMSEDSRDYGPVPFDRLIGRVTAIVWPRDHAQSL